MYSYIIFIVYTFYFPKDESIMFYLIINGFCFMNFLNNKVFNLKIKSLVSLHWSRSMLNINRLA